MSTQTDLDKFNINAALVRKSAHDTWLKDHPWWRVHILVAIKGFMPYLVIFIAFGFYLQSAPHTVAMFEALAPSAGWIAPLIVEGSLIYLEFLRQEHRLAGTKTGPVNTAMEIMMYVVSVIVNGAGAFQAVASSTAALNGLSLGDILGKFGTLEGTTQVHLILVVLEAIVIPTGMLMAGDGFAKLAHWRETKMSDRDRRWNAERLNVLYTAMLDALTRAGANPLLQRTKQLAMALAQELPATVEPAAAAVPEAAGKAGTTGKPESAEADGSPAAKKGLPKGEAKRRLDLLFSTDPLASTYSEKKIAELTTEDGVAIGKTAINDYVNARKKAAEAKPPEAKPTVEDIATRSGTLHGIEEGMYQFAVAHFRANPAELAKGAHVLAATVLCDGQKVPPQIWNDARREITVSQ